MVVAAIAAVALVIIQSLAFRDSKLLADIQDKLLKARDENLAKELSDKDVLIAKANERAALAERGTAEAKLELAKFKAPRTLTPQQQKHITDKLRPFAGTPFDCYVNNDPEPLELMWQISDTLKAAGWIHQSVETKGQITISVAGKPKVGAIVTTGIEIQIAESRKAVWAATVVSMKEALTHEGIATDLKAIIEGSEGAEHPNAIHIKIGKKP